MTFSYRAKKFTVYTCMVLFPNIDKLDTLTFGGLKNGVQTLRKLLKNLGNPQDSYPVFHVAGTNGKGSVCQMLSQVLRKWFGNKVWLTISPHLVSVHERIQINSKPITDELLDSYLARIYAITTENAVTLSYFESIILVALLYFADEQVDYAVIEVGLGGTYDATNVFHHPVATVISSIGNDHRRLLWSSLTQIFRNKAGIMKPGVPCFTRIDTPLMHRAGKVKKSPIIIAKNKVPTNLPGNHQEENAWLVATCLDRCWFDPIITRTTLLHIDHPGRCQRLAPHILLDGAHNEDGVQALRAYLDTIRDRFTHIITVFGCTKTREEYPHFFYSLIEGDTNYLVKPSIEHRAVDPATYQHHLSFPTIIWPSMSDLRTKIPRNDKQTLIIIYGSLYLAGEVLATYQQHDIDT